MSDAAYTLNQIKSALSPVFMAHNVRKAVLFGSHAKGTARPMSDVDIVVDSGLRGLAFYGLLEDVANALARPVDLLDVSQIRPGSAVDREIKSTGVVIYG